MILRPKYRTRIEDLESRCVQAGWAATAAAVLMLILALGALGGGENLGETRFNNPWVLLDVAGVFVLGYAMRKSSRIAAGLLALYATLGLLDAMMTGRAASLLANLLWLTLFGRALHAAVAVQRARSPKRNISQGRLIVGALILAPVLFGGSLLFVYGRAFELGLVPGSSVVAGSALRASTVEGLREKGVLGDDEEIVYFYSHSMLSFFTDGNFFTASRVVSYADLDGERFYRWAYFEDIEEIWLQTPESSADPTILTIQPHGRTPFGLVLSREGKKDQLFYDALFQIWEERRPPAAGTQAAVSSI